MQQLYNVFIFIHDVLLHYDTLSGCELTHMLWYDDPKKGILNVYAGLLLGLNPTDFADQVAFESQKVVPNGYMFRLA